jgi:hypothetical protein
VFDPVSVVEILQIELIWVEANRPDGFEYRSYVASGAVEAMSWLIQGS